jgi:hypothetical protein
MELLQNLDTFQWILVGLGGLLLFWPAISGLFKESNQKVANNLEKNSLSALVYEWENLSKSCHEAGLHDACKKLDEVFPLLIEANEKANAVEE